MRAVDSRRQTPEVIKRASTAGFLGSGRLAPHPRRHNHHFPIGDAFDPCPPIQPVDFRVMTVAEHPIMLGLFQHVRKPFVIGR